VSARSVLRAGELELHVLPGAGGSIARFDRVADGRRQPLMRGSDSNQAGPLEAACFPLVPYCNRIRGGAFNCNGELVRLSMNMPPDPSPLHGQGWQAPWQFEEVSSSEALMRFTHLGGEWPWYYEALQRVTLDPSGFIITLSCRNLSDRSMPCGLGLHPYFPCDSETRLYTRVAEVWTVDEQVLPNGREPAAGRYDLRNRSICGQGLDNGFGGWSGMATIEWPKWPVRLRMSSPDCRFFQVYSPASGGLFVVEPVQHANAALNERQEQWQALGIELLQPGETRHMQVRFEVVTR
jgi:aldose 1-epimerase